VFLPSYDSNDYAFILTEVAAFGPHAPVLASSSWPGGFVTVALFVPAYLAYAASGFSVYWAAVAVKAIFFSFTLGTVAIVRDIGRRYSVVTTDRLTAFVLLNPALLYVNYVWANWDAFPVFFTLLAYYLLRYARPWRSDHANVATAVGALMIASFFYWYPLVLIPAFLLYERSHRARWMLAGYASAMFVALMAINVLAFVGSDLPYLKDLLGGEPALNRVGLVGLQYFLPLGGIGSGLAVVLVALPLPYLLYRWGVTEAGCLATVLLLFLWSSPVPLPDSYLWILWFSPLFLLTTSGTRLNWPNLARASLLPVVAILTFSAILTNGQPDGEGLFYFAYPLLHSNFNALPTLGSRAAYLLVYNVSVAFLLLYTISWVLSGPRRRPGAVSVGSDASPSATPPVSKAPARRRRAAGSISAERAFSIGAVVVVLVLVAFAFNATLPELSGYDGSGPMPLQAFHPTFVPYDDNAPQPIPTSTYTDRGPALEIYSAARPLAFGSRPIDRALDANLSVTLSGAPPTVTPVFGGTPYNVSLVSLHSADASAGVLLPPRSSDGVISTHLGFPLMNVTDQIGLVNSSSTLVYALNSSSLGSDYFYLSFQPERSGSVWVPIFELATPEGTYDLISSPSTEFLNFSAAGPTTSTVSYLQGFPEIAGNWNFVVFHAGAPSFWFDFDGVAESIPFPLASGNATLWIGQAPVRDPGLGPMDGAVSPLYGDLQPPTPVHAYYLNVTRTGASAGTQFVRVPDPTVNLDLVSNASGTRLVADDYPFSSPTTTTLAYFGKLAAGAYGLNVTVREWTQPTDAADAGYLYPVFAAVVAPYLFAGIVGLRMRAVARHSRTLEERGSTR